ncbi:MAG: hypothetical protein KBG48_16715 [Kofleriaceae bacterium]|nr:hypothetical protein [Kofleriaceae bacterium]MBP9169043.1 hypothetical protein [Kofleriaceae bacterium]MBP9861678.1 hypothetical protein [Kofleriaceae bacterium]
MPRAVVVAVLLLASCQFKEPADQADAAVDAPPPECEANTQVCVADRFTACGPDGRFVRHEVPNGGPAGEPITLVMDEYDCPLGCHATEPRCAAFDPLYDTGPFAADDAPDVALLDSNGSRLVVVTDTDVSSGELTLTDASGAAFRLPARVVAQPDGPEILVLHARSLTIGADMHLYATGRRALAFVVNLDVWVAGKLDASGWNVGAGFHPTQACQGAAANVASGGGGNVTVGGGSSLGTNGGPALGSLDPPWPLQGGCTSGQLESRGGGLPGGALLLASATKVTIAEGGLVTVAGGPGRAFVSPIDGTSKAGGGGSGGAIAIDAPVVSIAIGARLNGQGGSGAAAVHAVDGARQDGLAGDHDVASTTVPGARCTGCGTGGDGASRTTSPGRGSGVAPAIAGGGGALGRARIRTRTGTLLPPLEALQIAHRLEPLLTR